MLLQNSVERITRAVTFKAKLTAIGVYLLLVPVAFAQSSMDEQEVLDLFANYPQSPGLNYVAYSHACRKCLNKQRFVLYASWFLRGDPRIAMQTKVNAEGAVNTVRSVFNWADQDARCSLVATDDLELLRATIKELPEGAESVPLEFIVVVSFQQDGKWATRLYDRRSPPPELRKIYKYAHSTLDSN
jgi:hypothetical protein